MPTEKNLITPSLVNVQFCIFWKKLCKATSIHLAKTMCWHVVM